MDRVTAPPAEGLVAEPARSAGYQVVLTALLSANFGFVLFDRNASSFLMPFIQPELGLTNTEVGLLAAALSLTWSIAALGIGVVSDKTGSRKGLLVLTTVVFSVCSFASGLAGSFAMLLATRLLMGAAEGGIMPMSQSLIASYIDARHRGLAMGVAQGFGSSLMGSFVAPVMLVWFAEHFGGWRHAFFLAGAPGLAMAFAIAWLIRPPRAATVAAGKPVFTATSFRSALAERNVLTCAILSILLVSYLVVCWSFMPLFLTQVRGYDPATMSWLMGALGISATVASSAIPWLSDYIGRRSVMIVAPFIAVALPIAAMFYSGPVWSLGAIFVIGWLVTGVFPLFMAAVPSESVAPTHLATALGICMGAGELIGGVLSPYFAGMVADRVGLQAPLWIMAGLAFVAGFVALAVRETAPRLTSATRPSRP
jgi:ACS family hexuronate transporter-like MFS transporter